MKIRINLFFIIMMCIAFSLEGMKKETQAEKFLKKFPMAQVTSNDKGEVTNIKINNYDFDYSSKEDPVISLLDQIREFKILEELNLSNNNIKRYDTKIWYYVGSYLENLKTLDLSNNQISSVSKPSWEQEKNFKNRQIKINLEGNSVKNQDIQYLKDFFPQKAIIFENSYSSCEAIQRLREQGYKVSWKYKDQAYNQPYHMYDCDSNRTIVVLKLYKNKDFNLECVMKYVRNFSEISYLYLSGNKITNIDRLAESENLKKSLCCLYLNDNNLKSIDVLVNFKNLKIVHVKRNKDLKLPSNIGFYRNLPQLALADELVLFEGNISTSLDNWSSVEKLKTVLGEAGIPLDIQNWLIQQEQNSNALNQYKDRLKEEFETIKIKEEEFVLYKTEAEIIKNLAHEFKFKVVFYLNQYHRIKELSLNKNQIKNIAPFIKYVKELKSLKRLNLNFNNISDVAPLSELTNLEELNLYKNNIDNIDALASLTNLRVLCLSYNNIINIEKLSHLTKLETLFLNNNKISDIAVLKKIQNLKDLYLGDNKIVNISPLSNLKELISLGLDGNKIIDISPLKNLKSLKFLALTGNEKIEYKDIDQFSCKDLLLANKEQKILDEKSREKRREEVGQMMLLQKAINEGKNLDEKALKAFEEWKKKHLFFVGGEYKTWNEINSMEKEEVIEQSEKDESDNLHPNVQHQMIEITVPKGNKESLLKRKEDISKEAEKLINQFEQLYQNKDKLDNFELKENALMSEKKVIENKAQTWVEDVQNLVKEYNDLKNKFDEEQVNRHQSKKNQDPPINQVLLPIIEHNIIGGEDNNPQQVPQPIIPNQNQDQPAQVNVQPPQPLAQVQQPENQVGVNVQAQEPSVNQQQDNLPAIEQNRPSQPNPVQPNMQEQEPQVNQQPQQPSIFRRFTTKASQLYNDYKKWIWGGIVAGGTLGGYYLWKKLSTQKEAIQD